MLTMIVPVGPNEELLDGFFSELERLPKSYEVLLVCSDVSDCCDTKQWRWVQSDPGRGAALNTGVREASHDRLWFVHADTRNLADVVPALQEAIQAHPEAMLYFDLDYYDGGFVHQISAWGAYLRSRLFGAPFGDQAFCLSRALHDKVGGYRQNAAYGEDHLYARALRACKVPLVPIKAKVGTSARKHREHGWLRVVLKYQWMWISQALLDRPASGV